MIKNDFCKFNPYLRATQWKKNEYRLYVPLMFWKKNKPCYCNVILTYLLDCLDLLLYKAYFAKICGMFYSFAVVNVRHYTGTIMLPKKRSLFFKYHLSLTYCYLLEINCLQICNLHVNIGNFCLYSLLAKIIEITWNWVFSRTPRTWKVSISELTILFWKSFL